MGWYLIKCRSTSFIPILFVYHHVSHLSFIKYYYYLIIVFLVQKYRCQISYTLKVKRERSRYFTSHYISVINTSWQRHIPQRRGGKISSRRVSFQFVSGWKVKSGETATSQLYYPSSAISRIIQISYLKEWNQRPGHRRSDSIETSLLLCIWIQLRAAQFDRSPKPWYPRIPANLERMCFADEGRSCARCAPTMFVFIERNAYRTLACLESNV